MKIIDNKYLGIHDKIKAILATYCDEMGYDVSIEYRGQDWRASCFVPASMGISFMRCFIQNLE